MMLQRSEKSARWDEGQGRGEGPRVKERPSLSPVKCGDGTCQRYGSPATPHNSHLAAALSGPQHTQAPTPE